MCENRGIRRFNKTNDSLENTSRSPTIFFRNLIKIFYEGQIGVEVERFDQRYEKHSRTMFSKIDEVLKMDDSVITEARIVRERSV